MRRSLEKLLEKNSNWLEIKAILQKLSQKGFQTLIVGGAVREALLNRKVKEIDLASSAKPKEILKLFPQAIDTFKKYGVIFIPLKKGARLEIVSFRKDSPKSDGRRPEFIEYGSLETDFKRRDFTINALYYDLYKDQVLDFANGRKHLKEKKIKTIGKAEDRFKEDYLRMLRALRFESQLGFKLDFEIKLAIGRFRQKIKKISTERITEELNKIFSSGEVLNFIKSLKKHDLFDLIFPDLDFNKAKAYLRFFETESFDLKTKKRKNQLLKAVSEDQKALKKSKSSSLEQSRPMEPKFFSSIQEQSFKDRALLAWLALGLSSFYGNRKGFQSFLKSYTLSSRAKKEILECFNSVEILLKEKASPAEKWMALNGKAELVYQLGRALILQSKVKKASVKKEKPPYSQSSLLQANPLGTKRRKKSSVKLKEELIVRGAKLLEENPAIKITEEQLLFYMAEFQKRAKKGQLPLPLLRGSDLLNKKPAVKRENFSKILKKAYHLQLTYPGITKGEILKKALPPIQSD